MYYKHILTLGKNLLTIILFICISMSINAQSIDKNSNSRSYWQINVSGGSSIFFGDIKQYKIWPVSNHENEWRFAGGIQLIKQISPVFGLRGQALYGKVAGTRREWNKYFESNYIEFNLNTTISIRNIVSSYQYNQFWDAYLIFGVGITNYNTKVMDLTTKKVIQEVGYGNGKSFGGRTLQGIFTGGLGVDFRLSNKWNINLESSNRILNSDNMDGKVSGFIFDVYNYTSIGFSYKFGSKSHAKKENTYNYFEPKDNNVKGTEYDTYGSKPIEPPATQEVIVKPVVIAEPVQQEEVVVEKPVTPEVVVVQEPAAVEKVSNPNVEYRVQISAKYNKALSIQHLGNIFNIPYEQIKENTYNGYYIYTVGSFETYEQAREKRNYLRNNGLSDAFVVAFKNGHRLNKLP